MDTLLNRPPHRPGSLELFGAAPSIEIDRFLEALHAGRMGPRLQQALGGGPATCHVLDAKYEPGIRAIVLYEHGRDLLRGDLCPSRTPRGRTAWSRQASGSRGSRTTRRCPPCRA